MRPALNGAGSRNFWYAQSTIPVWPAATTQAVNAARSEDDREPQHAVAVE